MTSRSCRSSDQPKGCGGDIARDCKVARLGNLIAEDGEAAVAIFCRPDEKITKHHLRMVSRRCGFIDSGFTLGEKTRQQQSTFNLRACNRQTIANSPQGAPMDAERWRLFRTFCNNVCAHPAKRRDYAVHRAAREPGIRDKPALKCLPGEQASQKPHGRARISAIDFLFRRHKDALFPMND